MNGSHFDAFARALPLGPIPRRAFGQAIAGSAIAAGLARFGWDEADAGRRKKGKGKRNGKKRRGGNGGGGDRCQFALCDGECLDLDNDQDNCGACGRACDQGAVCVAGFCAAAAGSRGEGIQQFDGPFGAAFFQDAFAFVADTNNQRIQVLIGNSFVSSFGEPGDRNGQFLSPAGVAVGPNGETYVTDAQRHDIQRFDDDQQFEIVRGGLGSELGQFNAPTGVAVDRATGEVWVADRNNHSVQVLSAGLVPRARFGRQGTGNGEFDEPFAVAFDDRNGRVVVADSANNRIQILDREGGFIRAFGREGGGNGEFDAPLAVAVDAAGDIFVADLGNARIQQFSPDGTFRRSFGRAGSAIGEFSIPAGIAINTQGVIAVVDQGNNRLQVFFPASAATEDIRAEKRRKR